MQFFQCKHFLLGNISSIFNATAIENTGYKFNGSSSFKACSIELGHMRGQTSLYQSLSGWAEKTSLSNLRFSVQVFPPDFAFLLFIAKNIALLTQNLQLAPIPDERKNSTSPQIRILVLIQYSKLLKLHKNLQRKLHDYYLPGSILHQQLSTVVLPAEIKTRSLCFWWK